jgi:hypothetical protein
MAKPTSNIQSGYSAVMPHLRVDDATAALAAGAKLMRTPTDETYGDGSALKAPAKKKS